MGHVEHLSASGLSLPSVSQIPSIYAKDLSGFQFWICERMGEHACCTKAANDYMQESADLGNDIHELREAFLKGEPFSDGVPEYQAQVFEPIAQFYKESGYRPLFIEQQMTGGQFGGTLDGAGRFDKPFWEKRRAFWHLDSKEIQYDPRPSDIWIEDLKIKSRLDPLHPLQLYGYAELLKETQGVEAKWGLIIRREKKLDKKPEIQLKGYYLPDYTAQWEASLLMWRYLNGEE